MVNITRTTPHECLAFGSPIVFRIKSKNHFPDIKLKLRRLVLLILLSLSCENSVDITENDVVDFCRSKQAVAVPSFNRQHVPSSVRSRSAIARIAPCLIQDLERLNLTYGSPVFIRIFKEERDLEVWLKNGERFDLFRTYKIEAMSGYLGPKLRRGDGQAPEGFYFVTPSKMNPNSKFHLSFNLGYPNAYDRAHFRTGSALMVHGNRVSDGCFAMTDRKIEEIYALADAALRNGQRFFRVHCFPFRMKKFNLQRYANSEWYGFWKNLKTGHDFFERTGMPPNVLVKNKEYVFKEDSN